MSKLIVSITRIFFFLSFSLLPLYHVEALAEPLRMNERDKQAHAMVAFQATWLAERSLVSAGYVREDALVVSSVLVAAIALMKEQFWDRSFDLNDMFATAIGSTAASSLFLLLPPKSYVMEVEGGVSRYATDSSETAPAIPPPTSFLLKAQSTIWFGRFLGVHLFSGGMDNRAKDDSGKRLHYGAGLRTNLLSLGSRQGKMWGLASLWAGVDYGYLLFATERQKVAYPKAGNTMFYSVGMRLHAGKNMELTGEGQYIPYRGYKVLGMGAALGYIF